VRLYVVKADHLQPKDLNGLADPFVVVKFGSTKMVDKDHRQEGTLEPDFYQTYEFQTTFPGPSQLKVQIYDWNRFLSDQLIGETIIDLEDRWFHPKWQDMGHDHARAKTVSIADGREGSGLIRWLIIVACFCAVTDRSYPSGRITQSVGSAFHQSSRAGQVMGGYSHAQGC